MYGWIWRKLPFGTPGKLIGSLTLLAGTLALLWFVAFPFVYDLLPTNDGTINDQPGDEQPSDGGSGGPADPTFDEDDWQTQESPGGD